MEIKLLYLAGKLNKISVQSLRLIFFTIRSSTGYQPQPHQGDTLLLLLGLRTGVWQDKWLVDHLYWHNITLNCHIIVFPTFSDKNTHFTQCEYAEKAYCKVIKTIISALCRLEFTYLSENLKRKNYEIIAMKWCFKWKVITDWAEEPH